MVNITMNVTLSKIMREVRRGCSKDDLPPSTFYTFYLPRTYKDKPYSLPVIGLPSRGCSWLHRSGGCTMCYFGIGFNVSDHDVLRAAEWGIEACRYKPEIHMTPLGSFFDDREVTPEVRRSILKLVSNCKYIELFGTESRAEYITEEKVREAISTLGKTKLEVGIGLESSNEFVREFCVNKNLPTDTFLEAVETLEKFGAVTSAHVLLKPPFMTEREAIYDAVKSIKFCAKRVDKIIFLPLNKRSKGTLVNVLERMGTFRLPWLWSFLEVLSTLPRSCLKKLRVSGFVGNPTLVRTAHNCKNCTPHILSLIENFCYTRDFGYIKRAIKLECECKREWRKEIKRKAPPLEARLPAEYEKVYEFLQKFKNREWLADT